MIDLKDLRENPDKYRAGAAAKGIDVDVDALLELDKQLRALQHEREKLTAEKNRIAKQIGQALSQASRRAAIEHEDAGNPDALEYGEAAEWERIAEGLKKKAEELQKKSTELKQREQELEKQIGRLQPRRDQLLIDVPQPPDPEVPRGASEADNVEIRAWHPEGFDPARSFRENRGFEPRSHIDLGQALGLMDFQRAVKMAGARSYVLTGAGMLLHQAVLRCAFDYMIHEHGFSPVSVPVLVRDAMMYGSGFFPAGREDIYEIKETERGGGHDLYLTGTGEVGLMGLHAEEILAPDTLPRCYTTLSTCFRREAGAAGRETAGLYRIHQFEKVEQVVICEADPEASRRWHRKMVGFVETLLQRLALPYRVLQICTADLGHAKADQIDIECWMPSRGDTSGTSGGSGASGGAYGETHSASKLYDYQCRRLNLRYKDPKAGKNVFAHSLNNTVVASPRLLIPILEIYQNEDGTVTVPELLRPYMNGLEMIR